MNGTLIVAEHLRGELRELTRELVTAAQQLGGPVTVAVIARDPTEFDVSFDGVDEIVNVSLGQEEFENDVYQAALEALIADREPHAVLLGFTVNSMGYGPAVAAKLALGFASDVHGLALEGAALIATRSFYGATHATSSSRRRPPAMSTSRLRTFCCRSAAVSATRRRFRNSSSSPTSWAPCSRFRVHSSTPAGCRMRARSASPGRRSSPRSISHSASPARFNTWQA